MLFYTPTLHISLFDFLSLTVFELSTKKVVPVKIGCSPGKGPASSLGELSTLAAS
jgi:hypothetical protein